MISRAEGQRRFYGWIALIGAMLVYFGMCGDVYYAYGVFLPVMCEDLGWSRFALSGPYTAYLIAGGLIGPLAGISVSKFGARKNIIAGNLVATLGLLGMSFIREIWHAYLFFGIFIGASLAFGTYIATTTIVNDWFTRRRTLAMGLLVAAGGISGFAFPPLISWLISSLGWRLSWVCLAGIHLVLVVVVGGMLIRNKPEEVGQVPDGEVTRESREDVVGSPAQRQVYQTPVDWGVKNALRTPALWLMMIFSVANMFTLTFLAIHQVAYLQDMGFSSMVAATALGLLVGMSVVGRLVCGALGSRFEGRYLAIACLTGFAIGVIILMNARALPLVYLYAVLSGISYGGIVVLMPSMFGAYFGRAHFARIIGWGSPITTLLGAASPLVAGFIYGATGTYTAAFWVAIAFLGVGVVCAFLARPPKPPVSVSP